MRALLHTAEWPKCIRLWQKLQWLAVVVILASHESVTSFGASFMGAVATASSPEALGCAVRLCSPASAVAMHAQTAPLWPAHSKPYYMQDCLQRACVAWQYALEAPSDP